MNVVMFLVGLALGGGIAWLVLRKAVSDARDQERNIALADVRVAEERAIAKDATIAELRAAMSQREHELDQRREENNQLKEDQVKLQTILAKEREAIDEKIKLLSEIEKQLKDVFRVLASDALKENTVEFDKLSKPVKDLLQEINTKITVVDTSAKDLSAETAKLVKALQKPEVRGQWGEMHLHRVVEVTGMTDRCDFVEQPVIGDNLQRPDVVVHLPGKRNVAVDAKAPIRAFLEAAEAADDETRRAKLKEFVGHVREHIRLLASKVYHQTLDNSPEFVVLYLPTEAVFGAALMLDAELLEYAAKQRVHLAGPTILITLLRAVAHGWKQEAVAENAREICTLAEELYKRLATFGGHMSKVGDCLNKSVGAYNDAVGSLESRVLPNARKFEQLGAAPVDAEIKDLPRVETMVRSLQSPELALEQVDGQMEQQPSLAKSE
jgi:DNA recombination protein RmuC